MSSFRTGMDSTRLSAVHDSDVLHPEQAARLPGSTQVPPRTPGASGMTRSSICKAEPSVTATASLLPSGDRAAPLSWPPVIGRAVPAPGSPMVAVAVISGRRVSRMTG
jgi:hypothetical protein